MPDEGVLAELWAGARATEAEMVRWLATPLLVIGLGVDGVAIWSRVQARPILFVTEVQTPNVLGIDRVVLGYEMRLYVSKGPVPK
jgi:hypothetical protein